MRYTLVASLVGLVWAVSSSVAVDFGTKQVTLGSSSPRSSSTGDRPEEAVRTVHRPKKKPLKGRFLHVTDFHPDPHYATGATFDTGCHRLPKQKKHKDKKGKGKLHSNGEIVESQDDDDHDEDGLKDKDGVDLAGKWGTAVSKCDSPMSLVNLTFDWLKKEWADEVDFVVWTGDNARHDIDRELPRSPQEIFNLNRMMVSKMLDTFGSDVPIVPSIGNNDIWPHNVLAAGPNHVTEEFLRIWNKFIPSDYDHVFERGAYFSSEVIPDRLAVISLNTLFWYDSNTLVDGCGDRSNDPGALQMDWLDVQLSAFRERGMQVWLTGHVPPHMGYYYDNCYLRYGDLALRYQDTIVGHLFGHMNIDHFFFIDVIELESTPMRDSSRLSSFDNFTASKFPSHLPPLANHQHPLGPGLTGEGEIRVMGGGQNLIDELKKDFEDMPNPKKLKMKDYVAVNVAASVIPTYLPGVRVFSYNITGLEDDAVDNDVFFRPSSKPVSENVEEQDNEEVEDEDSGEDDHEGTVGATKKNRRPGHRHGRKHKKGDCSRPENEDKPHCVFKRLPRYYSKDSPSRSNRPLTPLGYTQFYLPKVDKQTEEVPEWVVEYTTFKKSVLVPGDGSPGENITKIGEWGQPYPVPLHLLPAYDPSLFDDQAKGKGNDDGERDHKKELFEKALKKITPWKMRDLTIGSYVRLSRKLVEEKKMWKKFSDFM
ncbi:hypothetical protein IAU60_005314 [Kwoniella sp. DSM 27419]